MNTWDMIPASSERPKPEVDFHMGRIYLIEQEDYGFWLLARYNGVRQVSERCLYYEFQPLAKQGPDPEMNPTEVGPGSQLYTFDWARFPYVYKNHEVKPEDLPLYVSADRHWPAYEEAIKRL